MKTLAKILATLLVGSVIATATVSQAAPKMASTKTASSAKMGGKKSKKGYVHAHTYVKKNGTVVHVKGHYRHHGKKGAKAGTMSSAKMGGMKMGGSSSATAKPAGKM